MFKTFEKELYSHDTNVLKPLERIEIDKGFASPDEVDVIVANRSGSILSASTMLKSDLFTNLQKVRDACYHLDEQMNLLMPCGLDVTSGVSFYASRLY